MRLASRGAVADGVLTWGRREQWEGRGIGDGGGGKQASDVGTVGRLIPDLGWTGPPDPRVGYIYLSSLSRKTLMAELAGAPLSVYILLGSILAHGKLYFSLI